MIHILTAALAALPLLGCTAREVLVTQAVDLELKIEEVTGTKVVFSITPSNENASYIFFSLSEHHPDFGLPDKEAAQEYLDYLQGLSEERPSPNQNVRPTDQEPIGSFSDIYCYHGRRKTKLTLLSNNTQFKVLLFQVNPKTREIIGNVISEVIRTHEVTKKPMYFSISSKQSTLVITPSDPERTYFWSFDRSERMYDNYGSPYLFLYSLMDVYEDYGFSEHVLSKGDVYYEIPPDQLWKDEEYCVCAIGYEDGEITSEESWWYFVCRDGEIILSQ